MGFPLFPGLARNELPGEGARKKFRGGLLDGAQREARRQQLINSSPSTRRGLILLGDPGPALMLPAGSWVTSLDGNMGVTKSPPLYNKEPVLVAHATRFSGGMAHKKL